MSDDYENPFQNDYLIQEYGFDLIQAALDFGYRPEHVHHALIASSVYDDVQEYLREMVPGFEEHELFVQDALGVDHDAAVDQALSTNDYYRLESGAVIKFHLPLSGPNILGAQHLAA